MKIELRMNVRSAFDTDIFPKGDVGVVVGINDRNSDWLEVLVQGPRATIGVHRDNLEFWINGEWVKHEN